MEFYNTNDWYSLEKISKEPVILFSNIHSDIAYFSSIQLDNSIPSKVLFFIEKIKQFFKEINLDIIQQGELLIKYKKKKDDENYYKKKFYLGIAVELAPSKVFIINLIII